MHEKRGSSESFWSGALFGIVAGLVAGVLLAPDKGENTRKRLKSTYSDYSEKGRYLAGEAREAAEDLKVVAKPLVDEVEARLAPIIERMREEGPAVKEEVMEKIAQLVEMMEKKAEDVGDDVKRGQKDLRDLKKKFFKNA